MISVFEKINSYAGKWKQLDAAAIFCARYLPFAAGILLIAISFLKNRPSIFLFPLLAALVSRFVFAQAIYFFWKRQRPSTLIQTKVLIPVPKNPSFPSAHASFFFAAAFILLFLDMHLAIVFLAIAAIISFARVFAGIHWLSDIIAGLINGAVSALVTYYFIIPWILRNLFY